MLGARVGILHHAFGFFVTCAGALTLVQTAKLLEIRAKLSKNTCRKITHISTALIYLLSWLAHPLASPSRFLAALAPCLMAVKCLLVGLGYDKDPAFLAMSRSGAREELLQGPFSYAIAHSALTVCFWRESIGGIVAITCTCAGDGFASLIGSAYGHRFLGPLPYNKSKTWIGSLACFSASFVFSVPMVLLVSSAPPSLYSIIRTCLLSSFVSASVESLSLAKYGLEDNALVAISACITAIFTSQ